MRQLPAHPLIYLADQGHAPYGQRPLAEIRDFSGAITRFLLAQGSQVIVVACNTASAAALHWLRREFPDVPFVGMEPAVKPAVERTRTHHVGVIATAATFQGELFASLLERYASDVIVHTQICPELVPLVEAGELDTPASACRSGSLPGAADRRGHRRAGARLHPLPLPAAADRSGARAPCGRDRPGARRGAADGARAGAARVAGWRRRQTFGVSETSKVSRFYTTGDPARFGVALRSLLGLEAAVCAAAWAPDGQLHAIAK